MKKALTVDLWDTLIYDRPEIDSARRDRRLAAMGKILKDSAGFYDPDKMLAAYNTSWEIYERIWASGIELVPSEQLKLYLDLVFMGKTPLNLPQVELLNAYLDPVLEYPPLSMPGAKEILSRLKSSGWKLGLISNTGRTSGVYLKKVLEEHGVAKSIDFFFFSDEHRIRKPHADAFIKTLAELKAEPQESLHFGDNWEADVEGARKTGMTPLWFSPNGAAHPDPAVRKLKNWNELEFLFES